MPRLSLSSGVTPGVLKVRIHLAQITVTLIAVFQYYYKFAPTTYCRVTNHTVSSYHFSKVYSLLRGELTISTNVSIAEAANQIADQVGETEPLARKKIQQVVEACGVEQSQAWLEETLAIEASGGLMVDTGERRRTLGGVFFYLVKGRLPKELRKELFPYPPKRRKKKSRPADGESAAQNAVAEPMLVSEELGRLEELRKAEQTAKERVAAIQALPPIERTGLMSAMKELERIREEMQAAGNSSSD
jgi:hypothetical protein